MPGEMHPPSLREVQQAFYMLVTAPEGVEQGLRDQGMAPADLERFVRGDAGLSAVERLDVYANMYFFRIRDILMEEYAKVVACVGEEAFHNLIVDYLLARPPAHPSVRNAGQRLPQYLQHHALAAEVPWIAALAALERARIEVFDAADADMMTVDGLRELAPEEFAGLPLKLIPAHLLLDAHHAVDELWQFLDEGGAIEEAQVAEGPRKILVWRHDSLVYHHTLDEHESELWPLLVEGVSFGVLCDRLAEKYEPEAAAQLAFGMLGRWVSGGLLVSAT